MTREEYINGLLKVYRPVCVLADKNECKTLHLRHRELGRDLVLHSFPQTYDAYRLLRDIRCENLPEVYDTVSPDDGQIVLEEYIDGMTVRQIMETGRYRYRGAKKVLSGLCDALSVLHGNGIIHRDIKPENILIGPSGRVVLIDFNASRTVKSGGRDTVVLGTVGYASPEQMGVAQTDARTDIYALGVLLNVMITGKHPSEQIARGKTGRIVKKCTGINPDDRFRNVQELKRRL